MTKKIILKLLYIYSFIAKILYDELLRQSDMLQIWGSISLSDKDLVLILILIIKTNYKKQFCYMYNLFIFYKINVQMH